MLTVMHTYRMTEGEVARLLLERDALAPEFGTDRTLAMIMASPNLDINLGPSCGSVNYDAGAHFFWVHTGTPIDWM